jgi:hypothetical protein
MKISPVVHAEMKNYFGEFGTEILNVLDRDEKAQEIQLVKTKDGKWNLEISHSNPKDLQKKFDEAKFKYWIPTINFSDEDSSRISISFSEAEINMVEFLDSDPFLHSLRTKDPVLFELLRSL